MSYALFTLAGICAVGAIFTIASVGRPRKPYTPADAAIITVLNAAFITILILAAIQLQGW